MFRCNLSGFRTQTTSALLLMCILLNAALLLYGTSGTARLNSMVGFENTYSFQAHQRQQQTRFRPHGPNCVDVRLDVAFWLEVAEADATQHGTVVPDACNKSPGRSFMEKFAATYGTLCGPDPARPWLQHVSSVECSAYPVQSLGLACHASNLLLNGSLFMGTAPAEGEQQHSKYIPEGLPGSVRLQCHMNQKDDRLNGTTSVWKSGAGGNLRFEQLQWFKSAMLADLSDTRADCPGLAAQVIDHAVMFVTRLDTTNPYHHTQVYIADHFTPGPFLEIWQRISNPYPVVSMSATTDQLTCFRNTIHAHYVAPGKAFLGYEGIGSEMACPSTLLMAVAHWQRYLFHEVLPAADRQQYAEAIKAHSAAKCGGQQQLESYQLGSESERTQTNTKSPASGPATVARQAQHHRLNVVWLSRSWFGRSMKAGGGLTGWQASRDLSPEQEIDLIKALEQVVFDWNTAVCAPPVFGWWQKPHPLPKQTGCRTSNVSYNFQAVELSLEDLYPEQLLLLTRTAVLVGVHGAALTNQIWMRPHRGAVVESMAGSNFHYRNMAFELGHKHYRVESVDVAKIAFAVKEAMEHVSSKY